MTKFNVPDMSCGHCTATIEKTVKAADAAASIAFDLEEHTIEVTSQLDQASIAKMLEAEGFPSTVVA